MLGIFRQIGDLLDRIDIAGWTLTLCGIVVIAVTILVPAYLKTQSIEAQTVVLRQMAERTQTHHANYQRFNEALRANDPVLLERLAWHHLRLQPKGAEPLITTVDNRWVVPNVDQWVAPAPDLHVPEAIQLPDSRLVRLITGEPRPWVLAFGAWLVLVGLMINPEVQARAEGASDEEDEEADAEEAAVLVDEPDAEEIANEVLVEADAEEEFEEAEVETVVTAEAEDVEAAEDDLSDFENVVHIDHADLTNEYKRHG